MNKAALIREVSGRIQFVVNDCSTFIRVRRELPHWCNEREFGGGNFMMAQSLFSALNFLAKTYVCLRHRDKYFPSNQDTEAVTSAVRQLKAMENQKALKELFPDLDFRALLGEDALTQWKKPRPNECANETHAFTLLVKTMSESVDLGFQAADAGTVWRQFRNRLAHMAAPASMVESGGPTERLRSFRRPGSGGWICNVDRLVNDIQAVASWVCQNIERETEETCSRVLQWILSDTSASAFPLAYYGYTGSAQPFRCSTEGAEPKSPSKLDPK